MSRRPPVRLLLLSLLSLTPGSIPGRVHAAPAPASPAPSVQAAAVPQEARSPANLPPRPPDAPGGRALAEALATLGPAEREALVSKELLRGNVPGAWRRFVPVSLDTGARKVVLQVAPDYLTLGTEGDSLRMPLSPGTARALAARLGCTLPTRRMVDAIHRAAPVKLDPIPQPPSPEMTTIAAFIRHHAAIEAQLAGLNPSPAPGTLLAGHKKDVVDTPRLGAAPGKVAIYGWHRPDGTAIQPLYLGHTERWVDYSHGIRLVLDELLLDGKRESVAALLADPARRALLSDEAWPTAFGESVTEYRPEPDVRVVVNTPASPNPALPVRLVLYALPAGNTIEWTIGRRLRAGDDWRYDIQHVGAQIRWLRARTPDATLIVAYLQPDQRSWVLWRRVHKDHVERIGAIVDGLRSRYPGARLTLSGHSAGGSFIFSAIDARDAIPDDVERIAFLDANYAYEATRGHAEKLVRWLKAPSVQGRHLAVFAYEDHVALLDGKTFVSAAGGTWGRSHAMLSDLGGAFAWSRSDDGPLQRHTALDGRVLFILRANPERAIWHTRLVEMNGLIHALLSGTPGAERGYRYPGARVYDAFIEGDR